VAPFRLTASFAHTPDVRHDRRALGNHGEDLAARWYVERGYSVVARNWRCRWGELDLVVERPDVVVFCEVKARTTAAFGTGIEAITAEKRARLRRLAAEWLAVTGHTGTDVRFDVVAVLRGIEVDVVEGAF
jgi:putative endonuclease